MKSEWIHPDRIHFISENRKKREYKEEPRVTEEIN
jgi:hypothetical protein